MAEQQTYNPYTLADIERYLQGKMSAADMHAMEKAALQDPFLSDAIEGYSQAPFSVSRENLDSIAAALANGKDEAKVIDMPVKKRGWLTVAASILAVAAVGVVAMLVLKKPANENARLAQANVVAAKADTTTQANPPGAPQQAENQKVIAQNTAPVKDKTATAKTDVSKAKGDVTFKVADANAVAASPVTQDTIKAADDLVANRVITTYNAPLNNNLPNSGPAYKQNNNLNFSRLDSTATANGYEKFDAKTTAPRTEAFAKRKSNGLTIKLSPLPGFDSTITVTQLNNKTRQRTISTDTSLLPQGGWETFREYVARQQHKAVDTSDVAFEIEGDVELEFSVDERGLAKEIKVIRSLNAESDKQAVEYVKNWPAWITTKNHKGKVVIQF